MSDLFDLLGNVGKRKPDGDQSSDDGLDFLTDFKKKVARGERTSAKQGQSEGITTLDVADLPEPHKSIMLMFLRDKAANKGLTLRDIQTRIDTDDLADVLESLVSENYLVSEVGSDEIRYYLKMRPKKGRLGNILSALDE
ncbi:MAG: hypothetical protein CUN55_03515 [Phototrophicales bacterium]|nr:MAG: hypothetical protein CUN55_03515 [Phototrophicales bacterium]